MNFLLRSGISGLWTPSSSRPNDSGFYRPIIAAEITEILYNGFDNGFAGSEQTPHNRGIGAENYRTGGAAAAWKSRTGAAEPPQPGLSCW